MRNIASLVWIKDSVVKYNLVQILIFDTMAKTSNLNDALSAHYQNAVFSKVTIV